MKDKALLSEFVEKLKNEENVEGIRLYFNRQDVTKEELVSLNNATEPELNYLLHFCGILAWEGIPFCVMTLDEKKSAFLAFRMIREEEEKEKDKGTLVKVMKWQRILMST